VYLTADEDLTRVVRAMNELKALSWFAASVRDIRAFRVEQWSDFTGFMKGTS
jgi:virulence-associated protein VapD